MEQVENGNPTDQNKIAIFLNNVHLYRTHKEVTKCYSHSCGILFIILEEGSASKDVNNKGRECATLISYLD